VSWFSRAAEPRERATLLDVTGLTKSFGPLTVLRQVSLQAGPGEIVAVAGGNGAGKSTLIGCIAGVLDADAGEVLFAGGAVVEITDYGAGIPPGLAEKIFEPRVRGTTEVAGTGLGLPIARGIVEAHGGTLAAVPAAPGASFVVALPADPPPGSIAEPTGASWNVVEEPEEQRGG
jgi:energy-coupling factor transporter ATP-binding protein EcfA2